MNGWQYSEPTFRTRFPEWCWDDQHKTWYLIVICEELIDGRWEGFVSTPPVYREDK